ncbi:MAG: ATP-binding protein [Dorea sp.]|jgi:hypothetical protein|nr:ATP-binding protein [Dorea sp.]
MEFLETTIHLIIARTLLHLEEQGHKGIYERFPSINRMVRKVSEESLKAWSTAREEENNRYHYLLALAGDGRQTDHVIESAVDLCLAVLYIPEFAALLQYYTGVGVTLNLAYQLEGISFPSWDDVRRKLDGLSLICYIDRRKSPAKHTELMLDDRVFGFLLGDNLPGEPLNSLCTVFSLSLHLHPLYAYEDLAAHAAAHLKNSGRLTELPVRHTMTPDRHIGSSAKKSGCLVQFTGIGGRRFLAKHTAKLLGISLVLADLTDWSGMTEENFFAYSMQLIREALFQNSGLCLYGLTEECVKLIGITKAALAKHLILPAIEQGLPLIVCTDTDISIRQILDKYRHEETISVLLELTPLDYQMRKLVWQGFANQYGIDLDIPRCARCYQLTPSEISRVLSAWQERNGTDEPRRNFHFSKLCYQVITQKTSDTTGSSPGHIIYPKVLLNDLKALPDIRKSLDYVISSVNGTGRIFEDWNLKERYAYGRAVTVLLCGPPGTGKTMSAHAIAHALDIPLYQVNLSCIVDKYIGETEKHLEQAFLYAEKTNMVLFFDEADSLFGRRSEVSDAKDKYANTEVSYLLQRIEQYEGIVLLATNLMNNIDPAFLRRIKYVIRFQPPDEAQRLAIWKSCLIPELPVGQLDLPYLARQFDFCGGTIKNILLNACAISVCENEILNMRHILMAVKAEYLKMDRIIDTSMWGEYAYLILP